MNINLINKTIILQNKKALNEYYIENIFEAGLLLTGWELKSLRAGKLQITNTYIIIKNKEAWLLGVNICPINTIYKYDLIKSNRIRKLLLHKKEIKTIHVMIKNKNYTCIPIKFYWKNNLVKCEIAIAKGKKIYDKRIIEKKKIF
ncbi:SsrA-binding protein [Candidatus Johnevansia muelleri]|uniref:SsrA-binding protein n=1 Tax=Candidatus Johnevansia muelleri TaxID=1495769 RepID=A0A078KBS4_9GAMM|nr:SsrA-binding protein [Candidatus Evansia muelleri]